MFSVAPTQSSIIHCYYGCGFWTACWHLAVKSPSSLANRHNIHDFLKELKNCTCQTSCQFLSFPLVHCKWACALFVYFSIFPTVVLWLACSGQWVCSVRVFPEMSQSTSSDFHQRIKSFCHCSAAWGHEDYSTCFWYPALSSTHRVQFPGLCNESTFNHMVNFGTQKTV